MRSGGVARTMTRMEDPRTRITLDLQLSGNPVEGELAFEDSEPRSFTGYAGLIAALETFRSAQDPPHDAVGGNAEGNSYGR